MKKVFRYMTRKSVLFLALQLASLQLFAQAELLNEKICNIIKSFSESFFVILHLVYREQLIKI